MTLVEATISTLIVSVMMVAAIGAAAQSARNRQMQADLARGNELARDLLGQIVQLSYEQPGAPTTILGPEAGETRATFNDVDDFNGFVESPPADSNGVAIPGVAAWTRTVVVQWVTPGAAGMTPTQFETGLKQITVTAISPTGKQMTATAYRSRYGLPDKSVAKAATFPCFVGVHMQVGNNPATSVTTGVDLVNTGP